MQVRYVSADLRKLDRTRADALCLTFFDDERPLRGAAGLCDWRLCGVISRAIERSKISGDWGEVTLLPARPRLPFERLLAFGLGSSAAFGAARYKEALGWMFRTLERLRAHSVALVLPGRGTGRIEPRAAAEGFWEIAHALAGGDDLLIIEQLDAQKIIAEVVERNRKRTSGV